MNLVTIRNSVQHQKLPQAKLPAIRKVEQTPKTSIVEKGRTGQRLTYSIKNALSKDQPRICVSSMKMPSTPSRIFEREDSDLQDLVHMIDKRL